MLAYIIRRVAHLVPVLLVLTVVVFAFVEMLPGNIIDTLVGAEGSADLKVRKILETEYGLDRPVYVRDGKWLYRAVQLDFGKIAGDPSAGDGRAPSGPSCDGLSCGRRHIAVDPHCGTVEDQSWLHGDVAPEQCAIVAIGRHSTSSGRMAAATPTDRASWPRDMA